MVHDKLQTLVASLAKNIDDNEKLTVPLIFAKLKKCASAYPNDSTIRGIASVFNNFPNDKLFIRKGELKDLYNKFYSYGTKFAELFEPELGTINKLQEPTRNSSLEEKPLDVYTETADPVLATALDGMFSNTAVKLYDRKIASKAVSHINDKLSSCGIKATTIEVSDGNEKFIIAKANYETPKGITSVYIPMEISAGKLLDAELFVGNGVFSDISYENIKNYIKSNAGGKLNISSSVIMDTLNKTSTVQNKELTNVELAVAKLNSSRKVAMEFHSGTILNQKMDQEPVKDVLLPKYAAASEFEEKLTSKEGVAEFKFGGRVSSARAMLARELVSMGYKNPRIVVSEVTNDKIIYGISLNSGTTAFSVPVKMASNIEIPSILVSNGSVRAFNKESIASLSKENNSDNNVSAIASPQYGLKPDELINNIRKALSEDNVAAAEDSLNVLASSGNEKAYLIGFKVFASGLANPTKVEESKCSMIRKVASSKYEVCGHTNLPLHKVYQDDHGNCRPLYRRGQEEMKDGAYFMNSKIFG